MKKRYIATAENTKDGSFNFADENHLCYSLIFHQDKMELDRMLAYDAKHGTKTFWIEQTESIERDITMLEHKYGIVIQSDIMDFEKYGARYYHIVYNGICDWSELPPAKPKTRYIITGMCGVCMKEGCGRAIAEHAGHGEWVWVHRCTNPSSRAE